MIVIYVTIVEGRFCNFIIPATAEKLLLWCCKVSKVACLNKLADGGRAGYNFVTPNIVRCSLPEKVLWWRRATSVSTWVKTTSSPSHFNPKSSQVTRRQQSWVFILNDPNISKDGAKVWQYGKYTENHSVWFMKCSCIMVGVWCALSFTCSKQYTRWIWIALNVMNKNSPRQSYSFWSLLHHHRDFLKTEKQLKDLLKTVLFVIKYQLYSLQIISVDLIINIVLMFNVIQYR